MLNLGISRRDFMENHYGRQAFLARGAVKDHCVTWSTFDDILFVSDPAAGQIQFFRNGRIPDSAYAETFDDVGIRRTRLVIPAVEQLLRQGATLVLNYVDAKSRAINDLATMVSTLVRERTVANAYIAFGGEGAFGKHWDTHDVFALQLIGRKRWLIYPPTFYKPLPGQSSRGRSDQCAMEPVMDICLAAGDVLYIPKGWWHEAVPIEGEETAHIAIGVHSPHAIDYVNWCCANVLPAFDPLRSSIAEFSAAGDFSGEVAERITSSLADEEKFSLFKDWLASRTRVRETTNLALINDDIGLLKAQGDVILNSSMTTRPQSGKIVVNGVSITGDSRSLNFIDSLYGGNRGGIKEILESLPHDERHAASSLLCHLIRESVCSIRRKP